MIAGRARTRLRTSDRAEQSELNNRDEDCKDSRDAEFSESLRRTASNLIKSVEKTDVVKGEDVDGDLRKALRLMNRIM
jgi:hypothetical protein